LLCLSCYRTDWDHQPVRFNQMFERYRLKSLSFTCIFLCRRLLPLGLLFNIVIFIILLLIVTVHYVVLFRLHLRLNGLLKLLFSERRDVLLDKDMLRDLVGKEEVRTIVEVEYFTWEVIAIDLVKGEISLLNPG
jgi:hypothetical protein